MDAETCQSGRSFPTHSSPASTVAVGAVEMTFPSSRGTVVSIEPTDFAPVSMASAPSVNTVQISAESVQDLRLAAWLSTGCHGLFGVSQGGTPRCCFCVVY